MPKITACGSHHPPETADQSTSIYYIMESTQVINKRDIECAPSVVLQQAQCHKGTLQLTRNNLHACTIKEGCLTPRY
jgi:hypothetical protein